MLAARSFFQLLLGAGADVDATDYDGNTPLTLCAMETAKRCDQR
jgi:ankyrin repeat protein